MLRSDDGEVSSVEGRHGRKSNAVKGHTKIPLDNLLDTIYFGPSHHSRLLQGADIASFFMNRWMTVTETHPQAQKAMNDIQNNLQIMTHDASMPTRFTEADWEGLTLETLTEHGWRPVHGEQIAPGTGERAGWDELLIRPRLLAALQRINPGVPVQYLKQALAEITAPSSQDAITENYRIHRMLVHGHRFSYLDQDGTEQNPTIRLVSHDEQLNDWLAVNQVSLIQGEHRRRLDVVLYLNGMPVSIIELKRAGSSAADVSTAHAQLQTYLREFPLASASASSRWPRMDWRPITARRSPR